MLFDPPSAVPFPSIPLYLGKYLLSPYGSVVQILWPLLK